jgi:hypothetical protein
MQHFYQNFQQNFCQNFFLGGSDSLRATKPKLKKTNDPRLPEGQGARWKLFRTRRTRVSMQIIEIIHFTWFSSSCHPEALLRSSVRTPRRNPEHIHFTSHLTCMPMRPAFYLSWKLSNLRNFEQRTWQKRTCQYIEHEHVFTASSSRSKYVCSLLLPDTRAKQVATRW